MTRNRGLAARSAAISWILLLSLSNGALALSDSFSYQGSLIDAGQPANGSYDLQFVLQTQAGAAVGSPVLLEDVAVIQGVFTVDLDFGAAVTSGDFQLQIGIRPGSSTGSYTLLSPPTRIAPTPQAQVAGLAVEAMTVSPNSISSTSIVDGSVGAVDVDGSQIQLRVATACASDQAIRSINADGSVNCVIGPVGPEGPVGATGADGPIGPEGPVGATGADGADGKTILNGTINPLNTQGVDGDFYINTATNEIFGPKAGGTWPSPGTSLVGPQGTFPDGTQAGEMNYWDGTSWVAVAPGTNGQNLTFCDGVPTWGPCPIEVGDLYAGGIVFYIFQDGDPGYDANEVHGLVADLDDLSLSALWGCSGTSMSTTDGIGAGAANTANIVAGCPDPGIAARFCDASTKNSFTDWYLPSKEELNLMYINLKLNGLGDISDGTYWSSTEYDDERAWFQNFNSLGTQNFFTKGTNFLRVRAIRAF